MPDYHRTNVNLLTTDVAWLRTKYGYGWTEKVRDIVHGYVRGMDVPEIVQDIEIAQDVYPKPGTPEYEDLKQQDDLWDEAP